LPVDLQPKVKTGGGGVIAYNTIYGAEPDGYTLCEAQAAAMMLKPLIMEEPNYDPAEYTYLPNSVQYYACAVVPTESDIETGQDLVEAVKGGAKFSATSETSVITVKMLTLGAIGGLFDPTKIMDNLVTYGKSETWPAVTKGEVQFSGGGFSSIIPFLKDDTFKVPLFFHRRDELPDIATELAPDATTLDELDISSSDIDKMQSMYPLDSIFPHLAPPELPSSKTKRLREAWTKAIDSEEYRTMAKDREIRFPIYKSGEEVGNTIANGIGLWREREDLVSMMQG
jgi:tripartite-type tricarboxylate transporter receptor subunit TctC